jgi:hypothetical protein
MLTVVYTLPCMHAMCTLQTAHTGLVRDSFAGNINWGATAVNTSSSSNNFGNSHNNNRTNSNSSMRGNRQQPGRFSALLSATAGDFACDNNTAVTSDDAGSSPITYDIATAADTASTATASSATSGLDLLADNAIDRSNSSSSSRSRYIITGSDSKHPGRTLFTAGGRYKKLAPLK